MTKRGAGVLFLAGLLAAPLAAQSLAVPPLEGRVNDYANMISAPTRDYLTNELAALEQSDSTQVVILTIPSLEGDALEDFSIRVVEKWGIGQKGKDNGVLILVSKADRAVRIEVGYGLEGTLTDLVSGRIVDNIMVPAFKAGDFDQGFIKGTEAVIAVVKGQYTGTGALPGEQRTASVGGGALLVPIIIAFVVVAMLGARRRTLGGIGGALAVPILAWMFFSPSLLIMLLLAPAGFLLGFLPPWSLFSAGGGYGGGFWGGGYYGGGFSGGSGGFGGGGGGFSGGGGGFGGGGASGGW